MAFLRAGITFLTFQSLVWNPKVGFLILLNMIVFVRGGAGDPEQTWKAYHPRASNKVIAILEILAL